MEGRRARSASRRPIRQAAAQVFDREAIAENAYDGTVDPLYSIVPPGYAGPGRRLQGRRTASPTPTQGEADPRGRRHRDAGQPDRRLDAHALRPDHRGRGQRGRAPARGRAVCSTSTLKSTEWEQYQTIYKEGAYDLFILGWFPDYPDTDDYLSPFLVDGGFFQNGYSNPEANKLVAEEQGTDDQAEREEVFGQLQDIAPTDVPFIPSWVGQNIGVYGAGMEGVEDTLDPAFIFRFWLVSKNA